MLTNFTAASIEQELFLENKEDGRENVKGLRSFVTLYEKSNRNHEADSL